MTEDPKTTAIVKWTPGRGRSYEQALIDEIETLRSAIDQILGVPGEDWRITRFGEEYEGWSGLIDFWCVEHERFGGCFCCEGTNLTFEQIEAIERAIDSGSYEGPS